ncbi:DUF445 domain-containing protein [Zavarzinia sp. CC-PAN008]|uniref:DUF445 domain-containing protein n=1 Tax=Zavarzinia sp. CC-PAN008 TaxID=3243332 RepID=UPI003F7455A6
MDGLTPASERPAAAPTMMALGPGRPDAALRLAHMRRVATLLLALMAALFVLCTLALPQFPWAAWPGAFAEAAMVGALADWFAVTALFRHPLGLPIPHTAIVPRKQAQIAEGLGTFVAENFLAPDQVEAKIASIGPGRLLGDWVAQPRNRERVTAAVLRAIPDLLRAIDDREVGRFLHQTLAARVRDVGAGTLAAEFMAMATASGQHQRLMDKVLVKLSELIAEHEDVIRAKVYEASPRWLPKMVDEMIFRRIMAALSKVLGEMSDRDSEARHRLDAMLADLIEDLKHDPRMRARLDAALRKALNDPVVRTYFADLATSFKARVVQDLDSPDSAIARQVGAAIDLYGRMLVEDEALRAKLDSWIVAIARRFATGYRHEIGNWIASVVKGWDSPTVVAKLEQEVGRDLQFIRINGTLVGGAVGLAIHALQTLALA